MKAPIYLLPAILIIASCNNPFGSSDTNRSRLSETALYDIDSVRAATNGGDEKEAQKKLGQAIDVYKNSKDPAKSIGLFKSSVLSKPSAKAYFELGSALLDDGRNAEAIRALQIAEQLDYSPLANVMFKLSGAWSASVSEPDINNHRERDSLAKHYLEVAIQMGYAHPEQYRNLKYFARMKDDYQFRTIYQAAVSGGSGSKGPENMLWQTFTTEFQTVHLPLIINTVYIADHPLKNSISYDYEKFIPEMRTAKFSREVENEFYYFALVKKEAAYTALLYAGKNTFVTDGNKNSPVYFFLATYDPSGKIIDKMAVAGQASFTDNWKVLNMQPNYTFIVKDYHNVFKYDPEQAGYDTNYVVKSEPLGTLTYRIAANGKFEKIDAPLAMR